jgi:hypothetical protein
MNFSKQLSMTSDIEALQRRVDQLEADIISHQSQIELIAQGGKHVAMAMAQLLKIIEDVNDDKA